MKNIILCPSSLGQLKRGVKYFPNVIKPYIKEDYNILETPLFTDNIYSHMKVIYSKCMSVDKSINIGGDHSIAIATGMASLNKYRNIKFIWIDAHADINTYDSSLSKNYHGMPVSYLTGLDHDIMFPKISHPLKFNNIFYIGIRDLDQYEWKTVTRNNIKYSTPSEVNSNPQLFYEKLSKYIDNDPIHISFDVDSIDPIYISSTGTPVPNGIDIQSIKQLMDNLMKNEKVVALDIVEMNTALGKKNTSMENFMYIFSNIFNKYDKFTRSHNPYHFD